MLQAVHGWSSTYERFVKSQKFFSSYLTQEDMSRFGRNYLEVGLYTEIRFPELGVRFVAVNDGVDSDNQMDNDFAPFRNIMNEWYAKDTSKKIRAVLRNKGMSGKRIATRAPYGYIRGADGNLIIDEEARPVVELIFQLCIEGNGPRKISRILQEREIPSPATLEFQRTGHTKRYHPDTPFYWPSGTVACMLKQDTYLGQTTNFKTYKPSFKSKRMIRNPPEKQVTFENTHPAIIDQETWDMAQKELAQHHRPTRTGEMALFFGLLRGLWLKTTSPPLRRMDIRTGMLLLHCLPKSDQMLRPLHQVSCIRAACLTKSSTGNGLCQG